MNTADHSTPAAEIDTSTLFRLPWTAADNAMSWLEPTRRCNMSCDACFAGNDPRSEKSLEQIERELDVLLRLRRCDAMLIAGGEPLTHPRIAEVVAMVRARGVKPVIFTNGLALDRSLLRELTSAGVKGFTFHVDAHQSRPGWSGRSEKELNDLRSFFADLLHEAGGLTCAFNTTVYPDTLCAVPDIVAWAAAKPDRVHTLTLVCVRTADPAGPFDFFAAGSHVQLRETAYVATVHYDNLMASDLYAQIRKVLPHLTFSGFLGGTVRPESPKWAIGMHFATLKRSYGSAGPRMMEIVQNGHHLLTGRYLGYADPRASRKGKISLLLALVDREVRQTARRYVGTILQHPGELFRALHVQSLCVVQPVDILPNGEMDACDGCPNRTYWDGRLVSSCRLEEYKRYGGPMVAFPKQTQYGGPA